MEELKSFLGPVIYDEVMALPKDAAILIVGPQKPTGKTWTKNKLNELGFKNVSELVPVGGPATSSKHPTIVGQVDYAIALNNRIH